MLTWRFTRTRRSLAAVGAALTLLVPLAACDGQPVHGEGTVDHGSDTYDFDFNVNKRTPSPTPTATPTASESPTPSPTVDPTPTPTPSPTQPPVEPKPLVGAGGGTGSQFDALNAFMDPAGKLGVERVYETNIPTTWGGRSKVAHDAGRVVLYSFKPDMAALAAGTLDSPITTWLNLIPATDADVYVTAWHEPEDQINAGQWGAGQASFNAYRDGSNRLASLADAVGNPRLKSMLALMGPWTLWNTSPYREGVRNGITWEWDDGFNWSSIDLLCADPYYDLLGNRQTSVSMDMNGVTPGPTVPPESTKGFMTYARNHGKPVALCEWGIPDSVGPTAKAAFLSNTYAWAKAQRNEANHADVPMIAYFQYNGGGVWTYEVQSTEGRDAYRAAALDARS